jgi:cytochrome c biogenesis protein
MMRFWKIARSLKTGIVLLTLLTLSSLVGVVLPQGLGDSSYIGRWGPVAGSMLLSIGFDHIFSSVWYNVLLGCFALNIFCCTISRLNASVKNFSRSRFLNREQIGALSCHTEILVNGPVDITAQKIVVTFRKKHFSTNTETADDTIMIDARRGRLREIGSALLHLCLFPLLVGGLIAKMAGFSYVQHLTPGETVPVKARQFHIRCDFFTIERNEHGAVSDYKSGLTLLTDDGNTLMRKVIEVNHPLVYKGIKIYQSSYSADPSKVGDIRLIVTGPTIGAVGKGAVCTKGATGTIDGTDISITADRFIPDFLIDMKTKMPQSRSKHHNNPAVYVTVWRNSDTLFSGWVFQKFGTMHHDNDDYNVSFISYDQRQATGLLIKENPGNPLIWFGIIGMSLGVLLVFWVPRKRYWAAICHEDAETASVTLGAVMQKEDMDALLEWENMQQLIAATVKIRSI